MSLINAMYAGVSGLSAEGAALGVVGDNVANANTIGFKQSRANFEDVLGGEEGAGVRLGRTQQIFAQGSLISTGQATDVALQGDGFFVVNGNVNGVTGNFYTRAGQLTLRNDMTLVNPAGLALQGYQILDDGSLSSSLGAVAFPATLGRVIPPKITTQVNITANLDATSTPPTAPWDPQNAGATSNLSTSIKVFDSLGNGHDVDVYFVKTSSGNWNYHALVDGGDLTGGTPGTKQEIGSGSLTFSTSGQLTTSTVTTVGTADFIGAEPGQALTLNFGTPNTPGATTQFAAANVIMAQNQDGYAAGDLSGVKVEPDGTVKGTFTNGQSVSIAKLAIAKFRSNDGLDRAGQNLWAATQASGEASLGAAGSGGRGALAAGALEQSTVDITEQFVKLMAHQRGFQANSKTITTADQMLQELMQIKR